MKKIHISIDQIPAIIWGEPSNKVYIYIHGKMSSKESAQNFAMIAQEKGYQTLSFDLPEHGERKGQKEKCDIRQGIFDLLKISDDTFARWSSIALFACSIGAYFSLHAYQNLPFEKCLFLSPIVNMDYLIKNMFLWFDVTEEKLYVQKEIPTPIDTLSWDYYQYVKKHPIQKWPHPTYILYGRKDQLQSLQVIEEFTDICHAKLTISKHSDHAMMEKNDETIIKQWLNTYL